jgi:hypothetical protein
MFLELSEICTFKHLSSSSIAATYSSEGLNCEPSCMLLVPNVGYIVSKIYVRYLGRDSPHSFQFSRFQHSYSATLSPSKPPTLGPSSSFHRYAALHGFAISLPLLNVSSLFFAFLALELGYPRIQPASAEFNDVPALRINLPSMHGERLAGGAARVAEGVCLVLEGGNCAARREGRVGSRGEGEGVEQRKRHEEMHGG